LLERALASAGEFNFEAAEQLLLEATTAHTDLEPVEDAREQVNAIRQDHAAELERKAVEAMDAGFFDQADMYIIDLIALGGQQDSVAALRARLREARLYGGLAPGQIIRDELLVSGGTAPDMVIMRTGSFRMGSGRHADSEKPRHRVTIARGFALGAREVTVGEFSRFVQAKAYRTSAEKVGKSTIYNETAGRLNDQAGVNWRHDYQGKSARPDLPVLHVSQYDARAYAQWLAEETGKAYRLPSEAEYEYVARAGGKGDYWWGEGAPTAVVENLTGERDSSPSGRRWTVHFDRYDDGHWGPAPAGSLVDESLSHPMGVFDIAGNASEWVADCWHQNYVKAPIDGSAWINPGCERGVVRGGNWASAPEQSRASVRLPFSTSKYGPVIGFRVARDL
jgi:formylglycine-generating enzyme required for sulfatase activity